MRFSASQSGKLNINCALNPATGARNVLQYANISSSIVGQNQLVLKASSSPEASPIQFMAAARVVIPGGA